MRSRRCFILFSVALLILISFITLKQQLKMLPHEKDFLIKVRMEDKAYPKFSNNPIEDLFSYEEIISEEYEETEVATNSSCPAKLDLVASADIQMLKIYKEINFDNSNGGVWKQGWEIEIDEGEWTKYNKLKVFVVPHSHNDPGWMKTADEYYALYTKHILDNMIKKLLFYPTRKFIWAEVMYFSMWWKDLIEEERNIVRRLVHNGQLEFVSGGWVMNDEASSYWISTLEQYTEGHLWLWQNLKYTPKTSWSIDPFGLSATQTALLNKMGFENMVIQRVHYSVKKHLAINRQLEFRWRQIGDSNGKTEVFAHIMPFSFYDIPYTCGPDPKICCQFDFKRISGNGVDCPWKVTPQLVTDQNVAERAELLLDQYRKKSELFKTNVLLVTLGDDFRFDTPSEWDLQYENYQKIFDYLNSNSHLHVEARFGTLSDYFDELKQESSLSGFPVLTGDFFTYADKDDHYWSGTYTSKPFYKRIDRVLLSYIRASDVILFLTSTKSVKNKSDVRELNELVSQARKALALFQHHDGLSGTADNHVLNDYGEKMLIAIRNCHAVIQIATQILLSKNSNHIYHNITYFNMDDLRHNYNNIANHYEIQFDGDTSQKRIVIFNSLTASRHEVVSFIVTSPYVEVLDYNRKRIPCQISPAFENDGTLFLNKYHLHFVADVAAFGLVSYFIVGLTGNNILPMTTFSSVQIYNFQGHMKIPEIFDVDTYPHPWEIMLKNRILIALFNKNGFLESVNVNGHTVPVQLSFARYTNNVSGAHLFLPKGEAESVNKSNAVVTIVQGPIISSISTKIPYVFHNTVIHNTTGADGLGIEIQNIVDISKTSNFELVMRLSTNLNNKGDFFTDANGYQFLRRKTLKKLPIQGNFYPMPTMAYIEDEKSRFSVLTNSPVGCTSLKEGQLEIMLDQRSKEYNSSGFATFHDNNPIRHTFKLIVEPRQPKCQKTVGDHPSGFTSLIAHVSLQTLLNPLVRMVSNSLVNDLGLRPFYNSRNNQLDADISLVSLRMGLLINETSYMGLVLHRQSVEQCFTDKYVSQHYQLSNGSVWLMDLLNSTGIFNSARLHRSSLTFSHSYETVHNKIFMCPMDIQAFLFEL